ncbi:MAG TPA: SDR family NAD(P)-dependent oxidoreductase [Hyphomonadaceae bacterium]|nr:SDR family NAD(P)-dependent oxidoreductase [Hyphomonadaceae bacterium]
MKTGPKRILVTGGGKRVGRFLASRLAEAGHAVIVHANASAAPAESLVEDLRKAGHKAWPAVFDLARADVASLIDQSAKLAGGSIEGLVNSASIFDHDTPQKMDAAFFDKAMAVNLRAPALLSQRFYEQAASDTDNCIVNILDQKLWNMNPDFYSYTLTKAGLASATDMMARAFAPKVRVNAIAPGLLLPSHDQTEAEFDEVASHNALQRPIDLEDLASALDFLMGNRALTAQVIHLDNGQRLYSSARDVIFQRDSKAGGRG